MVLSYSRSETMELTTEYVSLLWERKGVAEGEGNYLVGDGAVGCLCAGPDRRGWSARYWENAV